MTEQSDILKKVLNKTVKEHFYDGMLKSYIKEFEAEAKQYADWSNSKTRTGRAPRGQQYTKWESKTKKLLKDDKSILESATWYTNQIVSYFIDKNMLKVKPILIKRNDLKFIELEGFRIRQSRIPYIT